MTSQEADEDDTELRAGGPALSWLRIVSLIAAFTFLGGAIGYFIATPRAPSASAVDVGFYEDMITHHDQAVTMALLEISNGDDPVVVGFAREVLLFQRYEIGRMKEALARWGATAERPDTAMAWMGMPVPVASMPGLATDEQLAALQAARGRDADALFLGLMSEHHRGGIPMADYAAANAADPLVRDLAAYMSRNQGIEINEYRDTALRLGLDVDIPRFTAGAGTDSTQPTEMPGMPGMDH